jgi:hypothetical protein
VLRTIHNSRRGPRPPTGRPHAART